MTNKSFKTASKILFCEEEVVRAVAKIESNGGGFNADGTPKTLFEGHWFHKLTNGKYTGVWKYRSISYPRWTRIWYGKQKAEKKRLSLACSLDREAALKSASWGAFQIMGFNHKLCGFSNVQDFVNAMYKSEEAQLLAFINYIKSRNLGKYLREKDFDKFAYYYNGKSYKKNRYAKKMQIAYLQFKKQKKWKQKNT